MPTLSRVLADDVLRFDLEEEAFHLRRASGLARSGRTARTLLKDGAARVTLVALGAGGRIAEHRADGSVTILPLWGRFTVRAEGRDHVIEGGDLLALGGGVAHAVESQDGGVFVLTVAACAAHGRAAEVVA